MTKLVPTRTFSSPRLRHLVASTGSGFLSVQSMNRRRTVTRREAIRKDRQPDNRAKFIARETA